MSIKLYAAKWTCLSVGCPKNRRSSDDVANDKDREDDDDDDDNDDP